jgi:hypothetical protein
MTETETTTEIETTTKRRAAGPLSPHTLRAVLTLIGAGAAGFLVWIATQIGHSTSGGYWAAYGVLAGAGLVLAVAQRAGQGGLPAAPVAGFLLGFLPILIAVAWITAAGDPGSNWLHRHVWSWSGDLGLQGGIRDLLQYVGVLAFGAGVVLGTTIGPAARRRQATEKLPEAKTTAAALDRSPAARGRPHAPRVAGRRQRWILRAR